MDVKLSDVLAGLGRPISYYPNLALVLGTVERSVLLCQLWYWQQVKGEGNWFWKTPSELMAETGILSPQTLRTSREYLRSKGLVEERHKRLEHRTEFRVRREGLDALWADLTTIAEEVMALTQAVEAHKATLSTPEDPNPLPPTDPMLVALLPLARERAKQPAGDQAEPVAVSAVSPSGAFQGTSPSVRTNVRGRSYERTTTETTTESTSESTTAPAAPDRPNKRIKFDAGDQKLTGVTDRDRARLLATYPTVDVDQVVRELEDWLVRHPEEYLKKGARLADRLAGFCRTAATRRAPPGNGSAPRKYERYDDSIWDGRVGGVKTL